MTEGAHAPPAYREGCEGLVEETTLGVICKAVLAGSERAEAFAQEGIRKAYRWFGAP